MILLTTGTNEQPFDRLVRAATGIPGPERLVVQFGSSRVPHGRGHWLEFVSFEELASLMSEARVVVCHAGVGSIMLARRCGHQPVVVPRRRHLGEAVDDHQLELGRRLHAAGVVRLVEREADLPEVVCAPGLRDLGTPSSGPTGARDLCASIRDELAALPVRRAGRPVAPIAGQPAWNADRGSSA